MTSLTPLQRRLREARYTKAWEKCVRVLDGVGLTPSEHDLIVVAEIDDIWVRYLSRLRGNADTASHWPVDERDLLQDQLDQIADLVEGRPVVWFALVDDEPVGIEVSAESLLREALAYFVSPATDLMITSRDAADGLCVELNHQSWGDEYELAVWGAFVSS
jgi:hypothetical protein